MSVKERLREMVRKYLAFVTGNQPISEDIPFDLLATLRRRIETMKSRGAEIVKCDATIMTVRELTVGNRREIQYVLHFQYFIKQNKLMYVEEEKMDRLLIFDNNHIIKDTFLPTTEIEIPSEEVEREVTKGKQGSVPFKYNRLEAVKYAEAWWNGRNPAYKNFQDNCTNFISQCLHAGESPMIGYPSVSNGWWQVKKQWSWSWAVAHSFQMYLQGAKGGLRAKLVEHPEDLLLGDIIAYDFENDGRWNHTTIVTAKDENGMPLVNAHSSDSRRRYWAYEDSSKYSPKMKYKFFHILDNT